MIFMVFYHSYCTSLRESHCNLYKSCLVSNFKRKMSQASNHDRIETDLAAEKSIIEKHKERQKAILIQIAQFKLEMTKKITESQEQIQTIQSEMNELDTEMSGKKQEHDQEVLSLKAEIQSWVTKIESKTNEKEESNSNNNNTLQTLTTEIAEKKNKKNQISIEIERKVIDLKDISAQKDNRQKDLDVLNSKISEIQAQIESKSTEKNDLKNLQIKHEQEILEDIQRLTDTTSNMKIEIETSQNLRQQCDEKPI